MQKALVAATIAALACLAPRPAHAIEVPLAWCIANGSNCNNTPPMYGGDTPPDFRQAAQLFCTRYAAAHYGQGYCQCDGRACSTVTNCGYDLPGATPPGNYVGANWASVGTVSLSATGAGGAWSNTYGGPTCGCPTGAVFNAAAACVCQANWVWDGSQCVYPGYCTAPRTVKGETCVCSDTNATWNGATCECKADYVLSGGVCVPKCGDAQCAGTCSASTITVSPSALSLEDETGMAKCPGVLGGQAGVVITASAEYASTSAACATGCTATQSTKASGAATMTVCGARGLAVKADVTTSETRTFNKTCDKASCSTVCDPSGVCKDTRLSGALSGGTAWSFSKEFGKGPKGSWPVSASCKANITLLAGGKYESHDVAQSGSYQGTCTACNEATFGPTVSGKGAGSCSLTFAGASAKLSGGLSAEYAQEMLYTKKDGCGAGSEQCLTSKITGKFEVSGNACLGSFGRKVRVGVKVAVGGTCSGSSCSGTESGCDWTPMVKTAVAGRCE